MSDASLDLPLRIRITASFMHERKSLVFARQRRIKISELFLV